MKWKILAIFVLISCLLLMPSFKFVWAEITDLINATVKISICGNGIIEGGEDCEGEDLGGATCESLGYGPGTLSCDIACTFDTSGCSPAPTSTPTPTPTLTPTPTPTPTSTPTPTAVAGAAEAPAATSTPAPPATSTPTPTVTPVPTPAIPAVVAIFDADRSGRIEITEVFEAVKGWVEEWRKALLAEVTASSEIRKCDLNRDKTCNLVDLSILLYYIGR
jgi:hypothetical protein